jgi:hypothetical protein
MTNRTFHAANLAGLLGGVALVAVLAGCVTDGSAYQHGGYQGRTTVHAQATVAIQDDYDYFPGYETYYSRNRREFVYRDGNTWVRRPAPQGTAVSVVLASPSVRMSFRDSPDRHHDSVVRSYPKNWRPADQKHDNREDHR